MVLSSLNFYIRKKVWVRLVDVDNDKSMHINRDVNKDVTCDKYL